MRLKTAFVVPNPRKPYAKKLAKEVEAFLKAKDSLATSGNADFVILVSGDGTVLYNKQKYGLPIFAIGHGKSHICQADEKNWRRLLSKALSGFKLDKRSMLSCLVNGKHAFDSLNDVVVRSRDHRVVSLRLSTKKNKKEFLADGIVFSTPTGSHAYSYSCGGKKLSEHAREYVVAPIAPYKRALKPFTLPDTFVSRLTVLSGNADLVFDGQFVHPLKKGDKITVKKSRKQVALVSA